MEIKPNQENQKKSRKDLAREEAEKILGRHEEVPVRGLAKPEISPEYMADVQKRLRELREERRSQMAKDRDERDVDLIDSLKKEIKGLEALVKEHGEVPEPEQKNEEPAEVEVKDVVEEREKPKRRTVFSVNKEINSYELELKTAIDGRLQAIRSTDPKMLKEVQGKIAGLRDKLSSLRAEHRDLLDESKAFVKTKMREAISHYEQSKKERERHAELAKFEVSLEELKEKELDKKDMERWKILSELDAKQNRDTADYKTKRKAFESVPPESAFGFIGDLKKEAKSGNFEKQHIAAQLLEDIEAGRVSGFTETEAKFFAASDEEAYKRAEASETMGADMTVEEAVREWEKIQKQSSKGETEARLAEQTFIDYLHGQYPDFIHFTGKEYQSAKTKPEKIGFFKKLFSFGKPKTRLQEMEEALDNIPNIGELAGKFLLARKIRSSGAENKPISVKAR